MLDRLCWHFDFSSSSLSLGWHEDTDKKMSQSSLAQDQAKLGSKNALNRRVTAIQVKFVKKKSITCNILVGFTNTHQWLIS